MFVSLPPTRFLMFRHSFAPPRNLISRQKNQVPPGNLKPNPKHYARALALFVGADEFGQIIFLGGKWLGDIKNQVGANQQSPNRLLHTGYLTEVWPVWFWNAIYTRYIKVLYYLKMVSWLKNSRKLIRQSKNRLHITVGESIFELHTSSIKNEYLNCFCLIVD